MCSPQSSASLVQCSNEKKPLSLMRIEILLNWLINSRSNFGVFAYYLIFHLVKERTSCTSEHAVDSALVFFLKLNDSCTVRF